MGYFPLCMDLTGKTVILVGSGSRIAEKEQRLLPFRAKLIRRSVFCPEDLALCPAMVVAGDLPYSEAEEIARICTANRIPVNVVDVPELCSFVFPALICRGDLTVSVCTGGKAPGAARALADSVRQTLPEQVDGMVDWLGQTRLMLRRTLPADRYRAALALVTRRVFELGRVLTQEEYLAALEEASKQTR